MAEKILLQTFLLLVGVVLSEWIEITKVSNEDAKRTASYGSTLNKPQMQQIGNSNNTQNDELKNGANHYVNSDAGPAIDIEDDSHSTEDSDVQEEGSSSQNDYFMEYDYESEVDGKEEELIDSSMGFLFIIKNVQSQLLDFKGKSLEAKVQHLKKLGNNILHEVRYRISNLVRTPENNELPDSRLYKDNDMGYEGALMTIGLLTFAVFLINLVLKLIYTLKMKQHYYNQSTTSTTPVSIFLKKSEREIEQDEAAVRILRYLEEYHSKS